ncbi:PAS domain-containing protein [Muricauda sp. TY007]|uniref:PAS domain-containing protein n=1 Tax=Allomuricauda sp. TY007 TaxID=2683200 RepID=UPI0013C1E0F2|nr:PAS domain-containing protein [Muricauda sp. TY007]NDV17601.1 PAS domain-containing protein [Muricauda sp. TY007]
MPPVPEFEHNTPEDLIFDLCPHPMWIFDIETLAFLKVNKEAIRQYGYSEEEFLSMTILDIRPKEDIPKLKIALENILYREGSYKEGFFRHQKKNGTIFPVMLKANLITFDGKHAEIVNSIDISKTIDYEKKNQYQARIFQSISDVNNNLVRISDLKKALNNCFGIVCETLKLDRIYFFQNDKETNAISQKVLRSSIINESDSAIEEFENIPFVLLQKILPQLKKGQKIDAKISGVEDSLFKEFLEKRSIRSILILPLNTDITFNGFIGIDDCTKERTWEKEELKLLETLTTNLSLLIDRADSFLKVKESENRFKTLVQKGNELISIMDVDGIYKYVSPTHFSMLGLPIDELQGASFFDVVSPEDVSRIKEGFQKVLHEKQLSLSPYRAMDSNGNWMWLETVLTNHLLEPSVNGIVANTINVTKKVQHRMKRELIYSLSRTIGKPGLLKDCLYEALALLMDLEAIDACEVWLLSKDNGKLNRMAKRFEGDEPEDFYLYTLPINKSRDNIGLHKHVWETKENTIWNNLGKHPKFESATASNKAGIETAMGIPVFNNDQFIGCLVLFSRMEKNVFQNTLYLFEDLGVELGAIITQKVIEEEYRDFFEISPDPFCIIGFDGKLKQANEACAKSLGIQKNDLLGSDYNKFIHKSDRAFLQQKFKEDKEIFIDEGNELRMITSNGDPKWFVWSGTIKHEEKLILAVAKDITSQKAVEKSLTKANKQLKQAQKIAKLGYWHRDFKKEKSEWSEETYKLYGYTPENFTPTMENVTKTFHPDDRYLIENDPNNHLEPGKVKGFEHRIIRASGEIGWVHQEIQLMLDDEGNPSHIEGTIQDITEKKEYEKQLEIHNDRFHLAMLASNQMIWELNHQKNVVIRSYIDAQGNEQTFDEPFSLDNSWFKKIHPDDLKRVWEAMNKNISNKNLNHWSLEYRVKLENDQFGYIVDKCYMLREKNGDPIRTVGSIMDITISKNQIERIRRQNKTLKEIAWLQSHAIRAPLTRIMSLVYLYKNDKKESISIEDLLKLISTSVDEIDEEIHKITKITNNTYQND